MGAPQFMIATFPITNRSLHARRYPRRPAREILHPSCRRRETHHRRHRQNRRQPPHRHRHGSGKNRSSRLAARSRRLPLQRRQAHPAQALQPHPLRRRNPPPPPWQLDRRDARSSGKSLTSGKATPPGGGESGECRFGSRLRRAKEKAGFPACGWVVVRHTPYTMKSLTLFTVLAAAIFATSCRTVAPIDPMTGQPSARCLPGGYREDTTTVIVEK